LVVATFDVFNLLIVDLAVKWLLWQVCELLDFIVSLMEPPSKKDQIYLLLFEPGMAELLYVLLTKKEYSAELKEKILKVRFLSVLSSPGFNFSRF